MEEQLKEKIIKEQDLICEQILDANEIFKIYIKKPRKSFKDIKEMIVSDKDIMNNLNSSNLGKLLVNIDLEKNKEAAENIRKVISKKLDDEICYFEDSESAPFLDIIHSNTVLGRKFGNEIVDKIIKKNSDGLKSMQGTNLENLSTHVNKSLDVTNFLKYVNDGVFTERKIQDLEEMIEENEYFLDYFNFGLLRDDIYYNLPKDFIKQISKFPKMTNKLMIIANNNPKLFEVFSSRVNGYRKLIDNYDDVKLMLDGFSRNAFDIDLKEVNENTYDNLINFIGTQNNLKQDVFSDRYSDLPEYSENYIDSLNEYYDNKFNELLKEEEEKSSLANERRKEIEELKNAIENETELKTKKRYELKLPSKEFLLKMNIAELNEIKNNKNDIYLCKKYSMTYNQAKKILQEYGSDLDNIEGIEEEKNFFNLLKDDIENLDNVNNLYNKDIKSYKFSDVRNIKNTISQECAKTYISKLYLVNDKIKKAIETKDKEIYQQIEFDGKNIDIVKLKGKFDMFLHSTDTGFIYNKTLDEDYNFKKEWEKQQEKTDHILSTTYSTQDFIGAPPLKDNGVMYGFTTIPRENIRITGITDINTYNRELAYNSENKQYMTANSLPYNSRRVYSECTIEKADPDFVVLYDDATEEMKKNAYRAASQFNIPIVFQDKKEIAKNQVENLNDLINNFQKTNDTKVLKTLINKYETNVSGWLLNRKDGEDESHTRDIDNSRFKEDFLEVEDKIQNIVEKYLDDVENSKYKMEDELTDIAVTILNEKKLYEDSLSGGPDKKISGTKMSLDADKIVNKLNAVFEKKGMENYKINDDTNLNQYLKMKDIAKNAVCRERVSTKDVIDSLKIEEQNKNMEDKHI